MRTLPGYQGFVAAFERSAPTAEIEAAIWASPWASGHYANGGHWHYTPVEVVKAPPAPGASRRSALQDAWSQAIGVSATRRRRTST